MLARSRRATLLTTGALFLAAFCWGLAPVATRYLLSYFAPLQLVLLRFLIATLLFLPLLIPLRFEWWTRKTVARAFFCGLVGIIGYNVPVAYGLRAIPSGMAGLFCSTGAIRILLLRRAGLPRGDSLALRARVGRCSL